MEIGQACIPIRLQDAGADFWAICLRLGVLGPQALTQHPRGADYLPSCLQRRLEGHLVLCRVSCLDGYSPRSLLRNLPGCSTGCCPSRGPRYSLRYSARCSTGRSDRRGLSRCPRCSPDCLANCQRSYSPGCSAAGRVRRSCSCRVAGLRTPHPHPLLEEEREKGRNPSSGR